MYDSSMAGVFAAVGIIALIALAIVVLLWVLRSVGLMTIAKNRGLSNGWIAWIPIIGPYTLGAIADDINAKEGGNSFFRYILLGGSILSVVLSGSTYGSTIYTLMNDPYDYSSLFASSGMSSIGGLIGLAVFVITLVSLNRIFKCYRPASSTGWTVLCVFFPFLQSIFPFVCRNDQPNWINPPYQGGPGGYPPQDGSWQGGGGYAPPQNGGYAPPQNGGYAPPQNGGYAPPQNGGYNSPPQNPGDNNGPGPV